MVININNEEGYLHYYRQLIQFEETLKHEDACHNDFEIVHITDVHAPKEGRIKRSNAQPKHNALLCESPVHLSKSKNTSEPQMMMLKIDFVGKSTNRIDMRRNILENLHSIHNLNVSHRSAYDIF